MKQGLLVFLLGVLGTQIHAQYYYNDVLANNQSNKQYVLIKNNRIKKVSALSYESDGELNQTFKIEQTVNNDASRIQTNSSFEGSGNSFTVSFYADNKIQKTEDSSNNVFTITNYKYDSRGNVISINTSTRDAFMGSNSQEDHIWNYNEQGRPGFMLKIKDGRDTTKVDLVYDEKGNVGEEIWRRKGKETEHYYYYWNDEHQLTDIVRFNLKARKMLPDFLFEYDAQGRVSQMTQIPANSSNYMIWKYLYDEKGLKKKELVVNKHQQPVGRVEYQYQ